MVVLQVILRRNKKATFQNCREKNVNVLGRYAGGLVGAIDGSVTASNMTFERVMVITNVKCFALLCWPAYRKLCESGQI